MAEVNDSQGVQTGDNSIQINLFTGKPPRGPVVAGSIPRPSPALQRRDDLMAALRAAGPGVHAVTGMRGAGKTQLAAAYARECVEGGWRLVAWINAEDVTAARDGLAVIADRLDIIRPGTDLDVIAALVRNRLEADGDKCLIVYDNLTDPDVLHRYVPSAGKSRVLVTSTQDSALGLGGPTKVGVFTEQESLDFLAERTALRDDAGAATLAAELGYLPLALAQAAAVIAIQRLTYPGYLDRLRSFPAPRYLPPVRGDSYPRGVAEAISLSIDAVSAADQTGLASGLLGIVALLSPEGFSRQSLHAAVAAGPWRGGEDIDEALGHLAAASLLAFGGDAAVDPTLTAHRLVARVAWERASRDGTQAYIGTGAIAVLGAVVKSLGEPRRHRAAARDLVRQVSALNSHLALTPAAAMGDDPVDAFLLNNVKERLLDLRVWALWCLISLGDSTAQAIELGEPLVADCVRVLGGDHQYALRARNNLAIAYGAAGRTGEAISLFERVLADYLRVGRPGYPDALTARNNLASTYLEAGRTGEAISLFERVLADYLRAGGPDHPDTLRARHNLANAYLEAGRTGEAVPLSERVFADYLRAGGPDHPDTLRARHNLANAYLAAGRVAEAVPLQERALADCVRVLGENHPDTLRTYNKLVEVCDAAGRTGEAVPLSERVLAACLRVLGEDHPDTLRARNNLANAYLAAGRVAEAVPLQEQTLADCVRVLGDDHPDALASRHNLAHAYRLAGRLGEAVPLSERTVADCVRVRGPDHRNTLRAWQDLANVYVAAGRVTEAVSLHERVLADQVRVLGDDHPDTLISRNNLADAYRLAGRLGEAVSLSERTVAACLRVLGGDHPDTLRARRSLASARDEAARLGDQRMEPMEPVTLIVTALAAGASAGGVSALQDDVKDAVKSAYGRLRDLVKRRFRGNASAELVLAEHANDPDTWRAPLAVKLTEAGAGEDAELMATARALMELADAAGARGGKYNVTVRDSQGVQIGDGNVQVNRFGA